MVRQYYRLFIIITLCSLISLITSWKLYRSAQNILTQQIAYITHSANLPAHTTITSHTAQATGWPFGAWQRLSDVSISTTFSHINIAGATPTLLIGGTWIDWARSLIFKTALPLHAPDILVLRFLQQQNSLTARLANTHLDLQKSFSDTSTEEPLFTGHFDFTHGEIALSTQPQIITLGHTKGRARFAPQAQSNQALLSIALTSRTLTAPSPLMHYAALENIGAYFAIIPTPIPHNSTSLPPFLIRIQELGADLRPLNELHTSSPLPRIMVAGDISTPSLNGSLTLTFKNWQPALRMAVNSPWLQHIAPPDLTSFLQKGLHNPRVAALTSHPLSVTFSIDHGIAKGISTQRMVDFYTQHLQPYLNQ